MGPTHFQLKPQYQILSPQERYGHFTIPLVALTGGVACGKSSVAQLFTERGLTVFSADAIVRSLYATEEVQEWLLQHFPSVMRPQGKIDFKSLRSLTFLNEKNKQMLENFIHPRITPQLQKLLQQGPPAAVIIYEIPLLFEKNLQSQMDVTICVSTTEEQQMQRLILRDQIAPDLARQMLLAQIPIAEKQRQADFVVDNSGTREATSLQVEQLFQQLFESQE